MAIDILRGKVRRDDTDPPTIGDRDVNVFSCPSCARPLVVGARRCPGCRTRLVMGIQLGRAGLFLALGVAMGSLLGGGSVALTVQDRLAAAIAAPAGVVPVPTLGAAAPLVTDPIASAPTTVDGPIPPGAVPPAAVWSLTQTAEINARIAAATPVLTKAAIANTVDTAAVAAALRAIVSDTASGADLSARLGAWTAASGLSADLGQFYADARATARSGLTASLSNDAAYRRAAQEMLAILESLGTLDARSRTLAEAAGVTLVPVTLPNASDAAGPMGPGTEPLP